MSSIQNNPDRLGPDCFLSSALPGSLVEPRLSRNDEPPQSLDALPSCGIVPSRSASAARFLMQGVLELSAGLAWGMTGQLRRLGEIGNRKAEAIRDS